jgi:5-methyltetrahydropteroyltriglutamate--homocysteine methyltransferase
MRRSTDRILTTHAGSLPNLAEPPAAGEAELRAAVADVVARQREVGLDLVNEGEYTKGGDWLSFADDRFEGFEVKPPSDEPPLIARGADRAAFADFYRYATERGTLFYTPGDQINTRRVRWVCTGPVSYRGHDALRQEIELLRAADPGADAFLTSTAPASLEVYRDNLHYAEDEEYLCALAEALREEYELIAESGLVLQVDDAWLPALWDRIGIEMGLEAFRDRCRVRVQALNHALRKVPEDRIRYHMTPSRPPAAGTAPMPMTSSLASLSTSCWRSRPRPISSRAPTRATSTSGPCGATWGSRPAGSSSPASSPTPPTSSSTRSSWPRGSCATPRRSAPRT